MATKSEKTDRRWHVVITTLAALLAYVIAYIIMFLVSMDVAVLNHLSTLVFGIVGGLSLGNWMTKPYDDD